MAQAIGDGPTPEESPTEDHVIFRESYVHLSNRMVTFKPSLKAFFFVLFLLIFDKFVYCFGFFFFSIDHFFEQFCCGMLITWESWEGRRSMVKWAAWISLVFVLFLVRLFDFCVLRFCFMFCYVVNILFPQWSIHFRNYSVCVMLFFGRVWFDSVCVWFSFSFFCSY